MVNRTGHRFTNEAANYNALGGAFHEFDPATFGYLNLPCWLVLDQGFVDRYGGFGAGPGDPLPEWVLAAPTTCRRWPSGSACPADALRRPSRGSTSCGRKGHDDDFGRGDSAYDGWCGDRSQYPGMAATLGPVDTAPLLRRGAALLDARARRADRAPTSTARSWTSTGR